MSEKKTKRRLYVVGGKSKNIPAWITAAFEIEQFDQDHKRAREPGSGETFDAVVVLSSWVGHKHFYDARALAEKQSIPMILSPGGWSSSLKSAAELGVEWFINDIEASKTSGGLTEDQVTETEEFIDNAWREAYNREWTAREALSKRHSKLAADYAKVHASLEKMKERDEAAQRVIVEVRAAAAAQRKAMEELQAETEQKVQEAHDRSERVAAALTEHLHSLEEMFSSSDEAHQALISATNRVNTARDVAKQKLDSLLASLLVAEKGVPPEAGTEQVEDPVAASNLESES